MVCARMGTVRQLGGPPLHTFAAGSLFLGVVLDDRRQFVVIVGHGTCVTFDVSLFYIRMCPCVSYRFRLDCSFRSR